MEKYLRTYSFHCICAVHSRKQIIVDCVIKTAHTETYVREMGDGWHTFQLKYEKNKTTDVLLIF